MKTNVRTCRLPGSGACRAAIAAGFAIVVGGVFVVVGCSKSSPSAPQNAAKVENKEPRYPLTGEILRVDQERKVLVVKHEEIKGFMPAMTMEFLASAGDLALAQPGQKIRAEMVSGAENEYRLENIWPNDVTSKSTVAAGANQLRQDTHTRGKNAYREIGETVPDFALYDQSGRVVQSARFRGKQLMLNFIFTRCPLANMCPAATLKMIDVQKGAREARVKNLELISISLDPTFDTPGVLRSYADAYGIDTANFSFLTGPESAVKDLLTQFGLIAEFEGDMLKHNLVTLLIDEKGAIAHRADGTQWEPADFVAKMKRR